MNLAKFGFIMIHWLPRLILSFVEQNRYKIDSFMSYSMSDLLQLVVSESSSDLHIRVGVPPAMRVHGILRRVEGPSLGPEDAEELMRSITSDERIQHMGERGGADFSFEFRDLARFRVSVFKEKTGFGMMLRRIHNKPF